MPNVTPPEQTQLRSLLAQHFTIQISEIQPLTGGRVHQVYRAGEWAIKVYDLNRGNQTRIQEIIRCQIWLAGQDLPVPMPQPANNGERWVQHGDHLVVVTPFVHGVRRTRGTLSCAEAAELGALLARLHQVLAAIPTPPTTPIPLTIADLQARWHALGQQAHTVPSAARTTFDDLVEQTAAFVQHDTLSLPTVDWSQFTWQQCHHDMHLDNVLFDAQGQITTLLDYDNVGPGWREIEAMFAWNLCFCADPNTSALTAEAHAFFTAYRAELRLPREVVAQLPAAYMLALLSNTWPAPSRYDYLTPPQDDWTIILMMRLTAARWLIRHHKEMRDWLIQDQ
jgi:Ser/Thr protein kinase RdoA (MazF antagonist)